MRTEPLLQNQHLKSIDETIKQILNQKFGINIQKIKLWFESSWTQRSNDQLQTMIKCNVDGNCMGLRIMFSQKSFGCFITWIPGNGVKV